MMKIVELTNRKRIKIAALTKQNLIELSFENRGLIFAEYVSVEQAAEIVTALARVVASVFPGYKSVQFTAELTAFFGTCVGGVTKGDQHADCPKL